MPNNSDNLRRHLRQWLAPLKCTPLHPQWLTARRNGNKSQWVAARATGDVLDIGCANSAIRTELEKANRYIGLDYPPTASELYGTKPEIYGDASKLPFADSSFDAVLFLDVLEHVAEPEQAIHETQRVLRTGGRMLIVMPFAYPLHDQPYDYQRLTEYGLTYRLQQAGFSKISVHEAGNGIESTAAGMSLSLAQGCIEAVHARTWRMVFVPLGLIMVPMVNILGWLFSRMLPAQRLMPGAYYVQAYRP